jgi:hypothetical protein
MKNLLLILPLLLVGCLSPQAMDAVVRGWDDYQICYQYFYKHVGVVGSQKSRYVMYKPILEEIERRELDCKMFPEFKNKKPFMEERVRLYEEQGSW